MENKLTVTTNIGKLDIRQRKGIALSIGGFLANVILEKAVNTTSIDILRIKDKLKLNP